MCDAMELKIKRPRCKASPTQLAYLAEHMRQHPEMSSGLNHTLQGRLHLESAWHDLANKLNALGEPTKTVEKWKQAWRDLRNNVKKKAADSQRELLYGSAPSALKELTGVEKQVLSLAVESRGWSRSLEESTASSPHEEDSVEDPLVPPVKQEIHWTPPPHDDSDTRDSDIADVSVRSSSPPAETSLPVNSDDASGQEGSQFDERSQGREEELHKLQVAEKMWMLKTLRERHATARLERERAQLERERAIQEKDRVQQEREWELKTLRERHAAAQLERERAQLERDRAQLQLDRAKHRSPDISRSNKKQIDLMLEFMAIHNPSTTGDQIGMIPPKMTEGEWEQLKDLLKQHGPDRSIDQWKQTWKDLKKNGRQESFITDGVRRASTSCNSEYDMNKSSTGVESTKAEANLNKYSDNMKNHGKQALSRQGRSHSLEESITSSRQEESCDSHPLVTVMVKQERHWTLDPDDTSQDFQMDLDHDNGDVSARSVSPPAPPAHAQAAAAAGRTSRVNCHDASREQGSKLEERIQERDEEIHKLKVAERVWILKTLRERHASSRLQRETAQFERDKAQLEVDKARFERDLAQLQRDKAQLELDRARDRDHIYDK